MPMLRTAAEIVTADIEPDDTERRGRIKVVGEEWGALTDGERSLRAGSKVRIVAMNGTRVMVEAVVLASPTEPPASPPTVAPPSPRPTTPSSEET